MELLWTDIIFPMAQTQSIAQEAFTTLEGCDYGAFKRF
jgi:hypothetical protein